jgi:hypothetical protein
MEPMAAAMAAQIWLVSSRILVVLSLSIGGLSLSHVHQPKFCPPVAWKELVVSCEVLRHPFWI